MFITYILPTVTFFLTWQVTEARECLDVPRCFCDIGKAIKINCVNVTDVKDIDSVLQAYRNVYKLRIAGPMTTLPAKAFSGYSFTVLEIVGPLTNISEDAMLGIYKLEILNFQRFRFSQVPKAVIVPGLKILQLIDGSLVEIKNETQNMTNVTDIILNNNKIAFFSPEALAGTINVQYLNLSHNDLQFLAPETFANLKFLKNVGLEHNQLQTIDGCLKSVSPQKINLYGNNLTNLDNVFHPGMWTLKWLDMGGNPHIQLRDVIFRDVMKSLVVLRLNDICQRNLNPFFLSNFPKLYELHLDGNCLNKIPKGFFKYIPLLNTVSLSNNELISIEGLFSTSSPQLHALRYVYLDRNNLTSAMVEEAFDGVIQLNFSRNQIRSIKSHDLQHLKAVRELDLSWNPLVELQSGCFKNMHKVYNLDLSHTSLKTLNHSIQHLSALNNLFIQHSALRSVERGELIAVRFLKAVFFRNNSLVSVYGAFGNLSSIKVLDVSMNNLTTLTVDSFPPFQRKSIRLTKLKMADNPWACDCRLSWIVDWLEKNVTLQDEPVCSSPSHLEGLTIRTLNRSDFMVWRDSCPPPCQCYCIPNGQFINISVSCKGQKLKQIPSTFPTNVTELDLENNEITDFPGLSKELEELRILKLQNNKLTNVKLLFPTAISELSLAGNELQRFPIEEWGNISISVLTLSRNPWTCDCEAWEFRNWLLYHNESIPDLDEIRCGDNEGIFLKGKVIIQLQRSDLCSRLSSSQLIVLSIVIVLAVASCVACFCFRKTLSAWLYSRGIKGLKKHERFRNTYDAFLLYAEEDEDFALGTIAKGLEVETPSYSLCIPSRDIEAPRTSARIRAALPECNKTVVILTRNFLENYECLHLLKAAMSFSLDDSQKHIIFITNGEIPPASQMDAALTAVMRSCPCLRWGEFLFWSKLKYNLPRKDNGSEQHREDTENESLLENA